MARPILIWYVGKNDDDQQRVDQVSSRFSDLFSDEYIIIVMKDHDSNNSRFEVIALEDVSKHELSEEISKKIDDFLRNEKGTNENL